MYYTKLIIPPQQLYFIRVYYTNLKYMFPCMTLIKQINLMIFQKTRQ